MANSKFKEAQKIAKRLRAENPKLTQPQAVKKAFEEIKKKSK